MFGAEFGLRVCECGALCVVPCGAKSFAEEVGGHVVRVFSWPIQDNCSSTVSQQMAFHMTRRQSSQRRRTRSRWCNLSLLFSRFCLGSVCFYQLLCLAPARILCRGLTDPITGGQPPTDLTRLPYVTRTASLDGPRSRLVFAA